MDGKILGGSGVDWIHVAQKRAECSAVVHLAVVFGFNRECVGDWSEWHIAFTLNLSISRDFLFTNLTCLKRLRQTT